MLGMWQAYCGADGIVSVRCEGIARMAQHYACSFKSAMILLLRRHNIWPERFYRNVGALNSREMARLLESRVFIAGCSVLGGHVAVLLARLGVCQGVGGREDEGGAYSVFAGGNLNKYPTPKAGIQIIFETAPEKRERMMEIIFAQLENIAKNGPKAEDLAKVKEFMLKKHAEDLKENSYWLSALDEICYTGMNPMNGYGQVVESITTDDIRQFTASLLDQGNEIEVSMVSEGTEAK